MSSAATPKKPPPLDISNVIKDWLTTRDGKEIVELAFGDILAFFRLEKSAALYGYTIDELMALKKEGKTADDVAKEIVSRGSV